MPEFPVTLITLVNRIRRLLEDSPETTSITEAMNASVTTITVADPRLTGKGAVLEIDDELLYVVTDPSGYTTEVRRGFRNTTAATHTDEAIVRVNPRFSQANIKEAINVILGNWISFYAPQLVWDNTTAGNFTSTRDVYAVPTEATGVRGLAYKHPSRAGLIYVDHSPLESYPTDIVSTGRGITVNDTPAVGYAARVLYERPWPQLESDAATVPTDFPPMFDSLITEGAVLYLMGWRVVPKFRMDESIFVREQSEQVPNTFNLQSTELMRRNWVQMMHRLASMRAQPTKPRKVWR